jgi:hypothetical protein
MKLKSTRDMVKLKEGYFKTKLGPVDVLMLML